MFTEDFWKDTYHSRGGYVRAWGLWDLKFLLYVYIHFKNLGNFKNTSLYIRTNGLLKDNEISGRQRIIHLPWFFQDTVVLKSSRAGGTESIGIFPWFSFYYYKFHVQYPGVWSPCGWSYWTVDVTAGKTSKTIWSNILILQMMRAQRGWQFLPRSHGQRWNWGHMGLQLLSRSCGWTTGLTWVILSIFSSTSNE